MTPGREVRAVNTPCGDEGEENQEKHQKGDGRLMTQKVNITEEEKRR